MLPLDLRNVTSDSGRIWAQGRDADRGLHCQAAAGSRPRRLLPQRHTHTHTASAVCCLKDKLQGRALRVCVCVKWGGVNLLTDLGSWEAEGDPSPPQLPNQAKS